MTQRTKEKAGAGFGAYLRELTVMAAIVTTLMCLPVEALLVGLFLLAGVSFQALLTFDGALNSFQGLLAWWALGFVPASAYAAYVLPWSGWES